MRTAGLVVALLVMLFTPMAPATAQQAQTAWVAHLSGADEVPRLNVPGVGFAAFELNAARTGISYWLWVNNIQNVQMAHIHIGAAGTNGPVSVWLYPAAPPAVLLPGPVSGVIGQGTIAAANLGGPLAGQQLTALINALNAGNAYVNVHTSANPGGEIRGQVR